RTRLSRRTIATMTAGALLMIVSAIIIFINISDRRQTYAASNGDYRSKATGNWNSISTWEIYSGGSWIAASASPSSSDAVITILTGHTVTVTANVTVDQ